jgi:hypothetical protein
LAFEPGQTTLLELANKLAIAKTATVVAATTTATAATATTATTTAATMAQTSGVSATRHVIYFIIIYLRI